MNATHPYVVQSAPSPLAWFGGVFLTLWIGITISKALVGSSHATQFLSSPPITPVVTAVAPVELLAASEADEAHDESSPLSCCALFKWRAE